MLTSKAAPERRRRSHGLGTVLVAVTLFAGACGDDSKAATAAEPSASPAVAGQPLAVKDMWVKTAASGMTAAFGTLMNTGSSDVTVVKATSATSPMMELHEVATVDGEMRMRPKEGGITIPAGGMHELKPGGDHLMMMDVKTPVTAGTEVTVTLTFADGETMEFTALGKDFAGGNESYHPEMPGVSASPSPVTGG